EKGRETKFAWKGEYRGLRRRQRRKEKRTPPSPLRSSSSLPSSLLRKPSLPKKKYAATHTIAGRAKRAATGAKRCSTFGPVSPLSKKNSANEPQGNANPGGTNGNARVVAQTASVEAPTSVLSRNPPSENANGKT